MSKPSITFLSLFRKYGGKILKANSTELQTAAKAVPHTQNALQAVFEAGKQYKREQT